MEGNKRIKNFFILLLGAILFIFGLCVEKEKDTGFVVGSGIYGKAGKLILEEVEKWEENKAAIEQEKQRSETVEKQTEQDDEKKIEAYYGTYKVIEYCPTIYAYRNTDWISEQEGDMMVGRIIVLKEDILFTCDSERRLGTKEGRYGFAGNHLITEYLINDPRYSYSDKDPKTMIASEAEMERWFPEHYEKINGEIIAGKTEAFSGQRYYTLEGENKLIMKSSVHRQYFLLEKTEDIPLEDLLEREIGEEEQEEILQSIYGSYTVTAFLPTKFYPDLDVHGEELLPKEEAELMLGKTISLLENSCIIYDNWRRPNSWIMKRSENDYWLKEIEITEPDYQAAVKMRDKIYGLRDDMLPEEMVQEEYIEISVYPGYRCGGDNALPQFYQLADGQLLMLAMEQYFLLEKNN